MWLKYSGKIIAIEEDSKAIHDFAPTIQYDTGLSISVNITIIEANITIITANTAYITIIITCSKY